MFDLVPFHGSSNLTKKGDAFDRLFTKMFEQPFGLMHNVNASLSSFKVDIKDTGSAYELTAELPGMNKEDILLDYNHDYLTISATRNEENEQKEDNYLCRERHIGKIQRSFYIDHIDRERIQAKFQDGILHVQLPKQADDKNPSPSIRID